MERGLPETFARTTGTIVYDSPLAALQVADPLLRMALVAAAYQPIPGDSARGGYPP
ncbi:hypothetical protein [Streptomyces sp. DSS69]|uniref:hypothetical protein n=1 Tax=Streptomyces sp. DSS69 TaxID=3113369 RepID=UPI0031FA26FA